jgi:hypothetical protein
VVGGSGLGWAVRRDDLLVCPFGWLFWLGTGFFQGRGLGFRGGWCFRIGLGIATGRFASLPVWLALLAWDNFCLLKVRMYCTSN